ncbi:MAG: hypothetical protein H0T07_03050, partial [Actinobacteria bacterium]|nr:hypothetical protein [Actinomycetota bacterium]
MSSTTVADPAPRSVGSDGSPAREQALAWRLLIAVGVAYVVAQVALISLSRPPGWDETVYLSQVMPGVDALEFLAWRARGITLLVAPVTWLGGSVRDVRLFLMVASALTMVATFRVWIPSIGPAAPAAAVLFSFTWLGLLSGTEVMPNLWAALLGLATAGLIARRLEGGEGWHAVVASAVLATMALVRPTEATVLAGAIGLYVVVFRRTRWRVLFGLALGLVLGWLPWFIEMSIRFGGPMNALDEAAVDHFAKAPVAENVVLHLASTDGRPPGSPAPLGGVLWWSLLVILAIVAIARARRSTDRTVAILACFGTLALATEYLVFVSALAPRFLLPAYAFASIPAALGLVTLLRGGAVARAAGVLVLVLVIPWAIWQGDVARRYQDKRMISTLAFRDVGLRLRELADGRPCSFMSPHGYPQ